MNQANRTCIDRNMRQRPPEQLPVDIFWKKETDAKCTNSFNGMYKKTWNKESLIKEIRLREKKYYETVEQNKKISSTRKTIR